MAEPETEAGPVVWYGAELGPGNRRAMHWVIERTPRLKALGLAQNERDVLIALAYYAKVNNQNDKKVWPKQLTIAALAMVSEREARDCIRALERCGVIRVDKRPGKNDVIYLQPESADHEWVTPAEAAALVGVTTPAERAGHPGRGCRPPRQSVPVTPAEAADEHVYLTRVFEQEKENTSTTAAAAAVASQTPPPKIRMTPGQQEAEMIRRQREKQENAAAHSNPAQPLKVAEPTPADLVAARFFEEIGKPENHEQAAKHEWPRILGALITPKRPAEVVCNALTWAVRNDYWGPAFHEKNNPAQFAVVKFETFLTQMANETERNLHKPKTGGQAWSSSQPQTRPPSEMARKFKSRF